MFSKDQELIFSNKIDEDDELGGLDNFKVDGNGKNMSIGNEMEDGIENDDQTGKFKIKEEEKSKLFGKSDNNG